ncbi:MAG: sodium-translocating pyrophosphatase [Chrysiogenetes bacterium]|nr:sodium-translocating pyrophosphatase [Chrysiogenetes bacterium]
MVPAAGVLALGFAFVKTNWVNKQDAGDEKMVRIAGHIREGAMAFLAREYKSLAIFVVAVAILLGVANQGTEKLTAVSFIVGALCSGLAGFFGMRVATAANVRTSAAARTGLVKALDVAFAGGTVMGMCVVGLGVLGLSLLFIIFGNQFLETNMGNAKAYEESLFHVLQIVSGFSLGASSIALFARVGGGIYTKAADVGADLVGKVEAGIPEDDPRNPAVIADNVGDNVGDVAGMGADLFESYVGAIVGSMVLAAAYIHDNTTGLSGAALSAEIFQAATLPLILAAVGIVISILGTFFVRTSEGGNPQTALNTGTFGAGAAMAAATFGVAKWWLPDHYVAISIATVAGLVGGTLVGIITEYYTGTGKAPVDQIAKDSETGSATNIISGLGVGMKSTALPTIVIGATILIANHYAGLYGIGIAALGMLVTTGIQLAVDAYGPIADNAGGISEMAGLPPEVRERTDKLDAVGNTTAAIGKGFAIGSAALTALALFSAYRTTVGLDNIDVSNPSVLVGLLVGAMLPFLFSSMAMKAVGDAAFDMIIEVRRQFREIPGLMEGKADADYAKCVDISTAAAIKRMVAPGVLAVAAPVIFGFLSTEALGGLLVGTLSSGVMLAIFMSNAGGAWDNAKKTIEGGAHGGKGSEAHKAAVTGDTVGDPFKDTAGPSLNILIKLMSVVSLVIAPLLV